MGFFDPKRSLIDQGMRCVNADGSDKNSSQWISARELHPPITSLAIGPRSVGLLCPRIIEQVAVAAFGHPFGALEVRFPTSAGVLRFSVRVAVKDDAGDLAPVGTFGVGVKEAQILDCLPYGGIIA